MIKRMINWTRRTVAMLIKQVIVIYCVGSDKRLIRPVRYLAIAVAAYAISPIDLIPDFIPLLGLLDDIVLVPAGVALVFYLAPESIVEAARERAATLIEKPDSKYAALAIIVFWVITVVLVLLYLRG